MSISINENFNIEIYGFAGVAINRNWAETGMSLMNKMWKEVKANLLKHKGINIWVYEEEDKMFAGVELDGAPQLNTALELKKIHLPRYARCKHIGSYGKIGETGSKVIKELNSKGIKTCLPYLEIYGHWTDDESKLETALLWCIE
jgi:effector-binding domain-containing protein